MIPRHRTPSAPLVGRLVRRATARLTGDDERDGGFAMMIALMLIFIVASLSIAIAGVVYNQVKPTLNQRKDVATVNAAAAGLQVSLDQIRTASKINGSNQLVGVLSELRCSGPTGATFVDDNGGSVQTPGATFAGTVNTTGGNAASAGTLRYQTSVAYYAADPSSQPLSWLTANAMACPLTAAPNYAYLQTHGLVNGQATTSGDRTQHATYKFSTSNANIAGGRLIPLGANPALCVDAGTAPGPGTTLQMLPCQALGSPRQSWSYRNDLSLFYEGDSSLNLCIQASTTLGTKATLQTCAGDGTEATYNTATGSYASPTLQQQEWPFDDNGHFAAAASGGGVGGTCLDPAGQTSTTQAASGAYLVVVTCDGVTAGFNAWNPDPQVGAGKAGGNTSGVPGDPTNQYVNYAEFGRCLDITGQNVNADHLIDYPCKQAPDKSQLTFNQVWTFTAYAGGTFGTMSVTKSGTKYCLTAPSSGVYITVSSTGCVSNPTAYQLWQPTGNLQGNYPNSYELINKQLNQCMSASTSPNGDLTPGSSNIIVETCNNTLRQKWNAPPTAPGTGINNIQEDTGSANTNLG